MYDVIIIGGGPAGVSAAMVLGRCRRKVILFDTQKPRNRWSESMNGFITRDGIDPSEFIKLGKAELATYNIDIRHVEIDTICFSANGFEATDIEGNIFHSKKLLLATGLKDRLPALPGIEELYGKSVHHCPYCDGWESQDKAIAVYGRNRSGVGLALSLKTWSDDIMLFTDGTNKLTGPEISLLERNDVKINKQKITRLEGKKGKLQTIVLQNGQTEKREVMFFSEGVEQQSALGKILGCEFTSKGVIKTRKLQKTHMKGLYVAGDAARDMQLVIVAAAEGTKAAVAINMELQQESRK